jgi:hypothetical protein
MSKQQDELETPAAMEKRLGITAKTERAARAYAKRNAIGTGAAMIVQSIFTAGVAWERRRRAKDGY